MKKRFDLHERWFYSKVVQVPTKPIPDNRENAAPNSLLIVKRWPQRFYYFMVNETRSIIKDVSFSLQKNLESVQFIEKIPFFKGRLTILPNITVLKIPFNTKNTSTPLFTTYLHEHLLTI